MLAVLGSNSFSGSVLVSEILKAGREVVGISRSPELSLCYRSYKHEDQDRFYFYSLGSNFDTKEIIKIFEKHSVSEVVNFSSQSMVAQSWKSPWDWYETNIVWLSKIASALVDYGGLSRFVHFTTPEVYGSTIGWQAETQQFKPSTPYALSRMAGDLHLELEYAKSGFPVIFTRAANVYGPYQSRYRVIPKALLMASLKKVFALEGGGRSVRSFIYMEDVAKALISILDRGVIGDTYHISTNNSHSIHEVVEMCYREFDLDPSKFIEIREDRLGKDQAYLLDSQKLRQKLSWNEKIDLAEGIKLTKRWVDRELSEILKEPEHYLHKP